MLTESERLQTINELRSRVKILKYEKSRIDTKYSLTESRMRAAQNAVMRLRGKMKKNIYPFQFSNLLTGYAFSTESEKRLGMKAISEACKWYNKDNARIEKEIEKIESYIKRYRSLLDDLLSEFDTNARMISETRKEIIKLEKTL